MTMTSPLRRAHRRADLPKPMVVAVHEVERVEQIHAPGLASMSVRAQGSGRRTLIAEQEIWHDQGRTHPAPEIAVVEACGNHPSNGCGAAHLLPPEGHGFNDEQVTGMMF